MTEPPLKAEAAGAKGSVGAEGSGEAAAVAAGSSSAAARGRSELEVELDVLGKATGAPLVVAAADAAVPSGAAALVAAGTAAVSSDVAVPAIGAVVAAGGRPVAVAGAGAGAGAATPSGIGAEPGPASDVEDAATKDGRSFACNTHSRFMCPMHTCHTSLAFSALLRVCVTRICISTGFPPKARGGNIPMRRCHKGCSESLPSIDLTCKGC